MSSIDANLSDNSEEDNYGVNIEDFCHSDADGHYSEDSWRECVKKFPKDIFGDKTIEIFKITLETEVFELSLCNCSSGTIQITSEMIDAEKVFEAIDEMVVSKYDLTKIYEKFPREALILAEKFPENQYIRAYLTFEECGFKEFSIEGFTDLSYLFYGEFIEEHLDKIAKWDVSKIESFDYMFYGSDIETVSKLCDNWHPSPNASFKKMFTNCESIKSLEPFKQWFPGKSIDEIREIIS